MPELAHLFCLLSSPVCNRAEAIRKLRGILLASLKKLTLAGSENPRMKRLSIVIIAAAAAVLFAAACNKTNTSPNTNGGPTTASGTPDAFAAARGTFTKNCKSCHGDNGTGGPVKLE